MRIPFLIKLVIVVLIVMALSEFAPDAVNAVLLLILIGAVLGNWQQFSGLASIFSSLNK